MKILDFIKKIIFYVYNPSGRFLIRDSAGKVIPDYRRRRHSKMIAKQIEPGRKPRCMVREVQGRVSVAKSDD